MGLQVAHRCHTPIRADANALVLREWTHALRAEHRSDATVRSYTESARMLVDFLNDAKRSTPPPTTCAGSSRICSSTAPPPPLPSATGHCSSSTSGAPHALRPDAREVLSIAATLAHSPQGMLASHSRSETAERIRYPALSAG